MYFNKIYSSSTEHIITRSPSNNAFDIELQHPQPRRRQTLDYNHENDNNEDEYFARAYSIPQRELDQNRENDNNREQYYPRDYSISQRQLDQNRENDNNKEQYYPRDYSIPQRQDELYSSEPDQLSLRNNVFTIPTNLSTIPASGSIIMPPSPEAVEEK